MDRYQFVSLLGEGAYGVVYLCKDTVADCMVAVKRYKKANVDPVVMKMALREIRILQYVRVHKNVVKIHYAKQSKSENIYIVCEYVPYSLTHLMRRYSHGLEANLIKYILYQLLDVIDHLHGCKVLHRDIKPANILSTDDCIVKICDFGLSRFENIDVTYTDYVCARWYRAPEILKGELYGCALDMWSFGCIFFELVASVPLLPGK
jgi:cyclin-dependent kinase-like